MALIELLNITKRFGEIVAINHINLSVEDGEYICVLGPTGAGKTTLLRIIAGLLEPDEGDIHLEGKLVNNMSPENRNAVYMFQQYALFPHMDVWENVAFSPTIKDWDRSKIEEQASKVLEMVKLKERADAFPNELSGGMQQRVALARGIASGARILLLDEPLGALDARLRVDIRGQLRKLAKDQGLTVIHVTHDQEEALMIADRVVVLRNGKIEQIGNPSEIYSKPQSIFVAGFVGGANYIEGYVVRIDDAGSLIEMQGDTLIRVADRDKEVNERVVIAIRPEHTYFSKKEGVGLNNFPGKIESVMFIGGSMEYRIRLENNILVTSKILLSESSQAFEAGEDVVVSFLPEKCYVFPYPEIGLLKEIEAI